MNNHSPDMGKEVPSKKVQSFYGQNAFDYFFISLTLFFIVLISLFPIRNNDVWWHLAVGREMVENGHFITKDIFSFTSFGRPWVPQSYFAGIIFYLVYSAASTYGLITLRALLVLALFISLFRIMGRAGISYAFASPFAIIAALNMQSRFIIRPHLFEYLFIVLLLGFLLSSRNKHAARFYLFPLVLQIIWANTHPSFFLGPVIVLIFFLGETLTCALSRRVQSFKSPWGKSINWKPFVILILLLVLASLINPRPVHFFTQPLNAEQRHLISQYTLEWRSPFDPDLRLAAFHPYFELLLGISLLSFLGGITRLHLSSLLLVGFFTILSLQAHRFRVEFSLVALPLVLAQLKDSSPRRWVEEAMKRRSMQLPLARALFALLACSILIYTARDRIGLGGSMEERYPVKAYKFIKDEKIVRRPFHSIGFGSFLLWDLYPQRKSFIDGRSFAPDVYRDFLACQTNRAGFEQVVKKYDLDSFILPSPEKCDQGMMNVHNMLIRSPLWFLVYMDRSAYIYVRPDAVPKEWLGMNAYGFYHPVTFAHSSFDTAQTDMVIAEIRRAVETDPSYIRPWADLGTIYLERNQARRALEAFKRAIQIEPETPRLWYQAGMAAMQCGEYDEAVESFKTLITFSPDRATGYFYLGQAFEGKGETEKVITLYENALTKDGNFSPAYMKLFDAYAREDNWASAAAVSKRFYSARPYDYRSSLQQALSSLKLGNLEEALSKAKEAVQLEDLSSTVHALLAHIYFEKGFYTLAREEALIAIEFEEDNAEALEILNALKTQQ